MRWKVRRRCKGVGKGSRGRVVVRGWRNLREVMLCLTWGLKDRWPGGWGCKGVWGLERLLDWEGQQ